ncbi:hypothetical protein L1887_29894 [Cichorium endivia]|nr:hypothetical protein L1887_29894 [Cichorium endivia]
MVLLLFLVVNVVFTIDLLYSIHIYYVLNRILIFIWRRAFQGMGLSNSKASVPSWVYWLLKKSLEPGKHLIVDHNVYYYGFAHRSFLPKSRCPVPRLSPGVSMNYDSSIQPPTASFHSENSR